MIDPLDDKRSTPSGAEKRLSLLFLPAMQIRWKEKTDEIKGDDPLDTLLLCY